MSENTVEKKETFWTKLKDNAMKTTNGMAIGLFGTLIIGTIFDLFAKIPGLEIIAQWSGVIKGLMGAGIGLGVALSLKKQGVAVVAIMAAGMLGTCIFNWLPGANQFKVSTGVSDPLSCYVSAILAVIVIGLMQKKKTPVDLLLIPLLGLLTAMVYSLLLAEWVHQVTLFISKVIEWSFSINGAVSFIMCIIVSVLVGMALTAPISSVAICVAISIGNIPLASVAALIGCSTQMLGFAIHTARDNKWGSVIAVGIGTSMLQFKNIIKNPLIWLPTILTSAILAPFAYIFKFASDSVGAGMGTSGLVGLFDTFDVMCFDAAGNFTSFVPMIPVLIVCVLAPIVLVFALDLLMRKFGWIKKGDLSLED